MERPTGVKVNVDVNYPTFPEDTQWFEDMPVPIKADTIRSLAELEWALRDDDEGKHVKWLQRPYNDIEIAILKPASHASLRAMIATQPDWFSSTWLHVARNPMPYTAQPNPIHNEESQWQQPNPLA